MAIRANVTLTDAASTPVNHVYYPTQSADELIRFRDRISTVVAGQFRLSVEQRASTRQTQATKVSWKLETPILEQTSPSTSTGIQPAPTVAYTPLAKIEFVLPDRCTLQERKDLLAMTRDLIDEAIVTAQVQDLEMIW